MTSNQIHLIISEEMAVELTDVAKKHDIPKTNICKVALRKFLDDQKGC